LFRGWWLAVGGRWSFFLFASSLFCYYVIASLPAASGFIVIAGLFAVTGFIVIAGLLAASGFIVTTHSMQ